MCKSDYVFLDIEIQTTTHLGVVLIKLSIVNLIIET
jgi:hypothetical protein